jgi:hypothetical protein
MEWKPWQFQCVPPRYWESFVNVRYWFDFFAEELMIQRLDDWYNKKSSQLVQHALEFGGSFIYKR